MIIVYLVRNKIKRVRILFFKKHVIVIGLSRLGKQVAYNLAKDGRNVVVISNEALNSDADLITENGGFVLSSKGFDEAILKKAGLANASTVIMAADCDDTNIKVAQFISRLKKRKYSSGPLKLMVHVNDPNLKNLLSDYLDVSSGGAVDVQPFNINDTAAQLVYDHYSPHRYLVNETTRDNAKIIAIVGSNEIAKSFLIENSILSQYGDQQNLIVLLIADNAEAYLKSVSREFPSIANFLQLIPIELRSDNFSSQLEWDQKFLSSIDSLDAVYIFGNEDAKLINSALHLRQFLYEKTMNLRKVPIIVCLPEETKAIDLLEADEEKSGKKSLSEKLSEELVIFLVRKFSDSCSVKRLIDGSGENEVLAKTINFYYSIKYEFDSLLNTHFKKSGNTEFINHLEREFLEFKVKRGDPLSQIEHLVLDFTKVYTKSSIQKVKSIFAVNRLWHNLSDRKKESNRYVARHLGVKLHILKKLGIKNFTPDELKKHLHKIGPIEHGRWSAEKLAFGFSYGTLPPTDRNLKKILKDSLKIHDQLIPYDQLDTVNKEKDLDMFYILPLLHKIKENIKD